MAKFAGLVKDLTADLTADVLQLTTDLADLATFNGNVGHRVSTLEGQAADAEDAIDAMKATIKGLETRVDNLFKSDTAHTWYKENKARLNVLEKQIGDLTREAKEHEATDVAARAALADQVATCCDSERLAVASLHQRSG